MVESAKVVAARATVSRRQFAGWIAACAATSTAGCTGVPVAVGQSKKADDYGEKLRRVLVVRNLYISGMSELNMNGLIQLRELETAFNAKLAVPYHLQADYVDVTRYSKTGDESEGRKEAVQQAIATMHPSQVLELKAVSATLHPQLLKYTINASIYDTATKKIVWRAQFTVDNMAGRLVRAGERLAPSHQEEADLLVDALGVQLKAAGLL